MKKKYIIYAPKYGKSNGVRVLYKLAENLIQQGFEAYLYAPVSDKVACNFINAVTPEMRKNDIIIYPETVTRNPLQFQNVVRWVLYYPGKINGDKEFFDHELIFVYNRKYYNKGDLLTQPSLDTSLFYYNGEQKDRDCYFVYKNGKWKDIPKFKNLTEININFPEKREDLANLLRKTNTLYSYDDSTILLEEALLCGCKVKLVTENGFTDYKSNYANSVKDYPNQLLNFIDKTQTMNYQGKPQRILISGVISRTIYHLRYLFFKKIVKNDNEAIRLYNKYKFALK